MRRRTGLLDHPLVGNQTGTVFGPSSASCRCCHTAASCQSAPSPAGHPGPKPLLVRQELPRDSRVQHEQDGAQHLAVIQPLAARDLTLLKKIARVRHIRDRLARASSVLLALFCRIQCYRSIAVSRLTCAHGDRHRGRRQIGSFGNTHPQGQSQAAIGYELVAEEPPEVTAISCMRCVKPLSLAGIVMASAVGSSAIA